VPPRLVAIDLPASAAFVDVLRRIWDDGDAAFVLDRRLPPPARTAALAAARPGAVVDARGEHALDGGEPVEDGDALVLTTSGTTGDPKAVVLTHDAVRASAVASSRRLGVTAGDHWLACLPLSHVGGLSVVTRALVTGTGLTVHDGFDADAVAAAADAGVTRVSLVATALRRVDAARFRTVLLGGARPPDRLPPNVVTTYGMTETGSGVVYDGVPLDGVEVRLGDDGEVHVRGPMLLRAYRDGSVPLVDGWLATGDVGRFDDGGRLVVHGRRGDMIVTGGENVWPGPVEDVLRSHPAVADVAVAGTPDEEWGQLVTAYVVAAGDAPTLDSLRDHVRAQLPAFAAPRRLVLVPALPRTALGKVVRHRLGAD
jgi:O-succinylbenzoic acid--CoA ligase